MKSPVFIFSLPRSGSTLLQKILMAHKDIASLSEPWIMLPFCYANKREGILSEYRHINSYSALQDIINNLPNNEDDYYESLNLFIHNLYEKLCVNNEKYFLDKTPRYYLIINEIEKVFPNSKFIFLFRNPIHIYSSMIETWSNGKLKYLYNYELDLYSGPRALSAGYLEFKDKSIPVKYEEFVKKPEKHVREICDFLSIEFDPNMIRDYFKQDTKGIMGDPTGQKEYKSISIKSLSKWKHTFNSEYRKRILKKYLETLDASDLEIQGYSKDEIIEEISAIPSSKWNLINDFVNYNYSVLYRLFHLNIFFGKGTSHWARKRFLS